ncbi:hypothetical protein Dimus_034442 [Dionaea muscipula]
MCNSNWRKVDLKSVSGICLSKRNEVYSTDRIETWNLILEIGSCQSSAFQFQVFKVMQSTLEKNDYCMR